MTFSLLICIAYKLYYKDWTQIHSSFALLLPLFLQFVCVVIMPPRHNFYVVSFPIQSHTFSELHTHFSFLFKLKCRISVARFTFYFTYKQNRNTFTVRAHFLFERKREKKSIDQLYRCCCCRRWKKFLSNCHNVVDCLLECGYCSCK